MTAGTLIAQVDALRPNQYTTAEKLRWLQRLDAQVKLLLHDTHGILPPAGEGAERSEADEGETTPPHLSASLTSSPLWGEEQQADASADYTSDSELLVPAPWDEELYTAWLFSRIDLMNAEIEKYDQSAALFGAAWRQYADFRNRCRRPLGERRWKL